ncbi:hypothetical protein FXV91_05410 [Methanosarcina sp. DH2]|uniref:hypothetical protein n=1 Tax=Methanosarcina sp. DH2 TaxID=2605639 RepID=UPI001E5CEC50|nr:hypothetical protein [Methanosarcina sp. DH2]MCC4769660.1 hypothetical protein [Methanosarcina sp. DH2]
MRDNNSAGFSRNGGKAKNSCQEDICIRVSHKVEACHAILDETSVRKYDFTKPVLPFHRI